MKIVIESTPAMTDLDGVPVRVWRGVTEGGVRCKVFVHRLAVVEYEDTAEFDRELLEQMPPDRHVPLSPIL